jgi:hypothetical protein
LNPHRGIVSCGGGKTINLTTEEFASKDFGLYENNPIIKHFGLSTVAADPSVLAPEDSGDGKWHLFCHTLFGVYRFDSEDGLRYVNKGKVIGRAMRPDIKYTDGAYYLYYERVQPLIKRGLAALGKTDWFSEICVTASRNLKEWTPPKKVVGYDREYERGGGISVSNPFLIKIKGKYRLYFSAGLTYLEDCRFSEPTCISYAESDGLTDGFVSRAEPVIKPKADDARFNKCAGCIKVYEVTDGYIALQNGIYRDGGGKTHSAVMLLKSADGEKFEFVKPLVEPQRANGSDWMAQYVYASSLAVHGGKMYLYFNARDISDPIKGRESIGLAVSEI